MSVTVKKLAWVSFTELILVPLTFKDFIRRTFLFFENIIG